MSFKWLLQHLLPPENLNKAVLGCECILPETAFFNKQGACDLIIKMDRNCFLRKIEDESKYQHREIYTEFTNAVNVRMKQQEGIFEAKLGA